LRVAHAIENAIDRGLRDIYAERPRRIAEGDVAAALMVMSVKLGVALILAGASDLNGDLVYTPTANANRTTRGRIVIAPPRPRPAQTAPGMSSAQVPM